MNYIYLIGNGFDLAHGLKTSYNDFITEFYRKAINDSTPNTESNLGPIVIKTKHSRLDTIPSDFDLKKILEYRNRADISFDYSNQFFRWLTDSYSNQRWVDIEYHYYKRLLTSLSQNMTVEYKEKQISKLNTEIDEIKKLLIDYLKDNTNTEITLKESIQNQIPQKPARKKSIP